MCYEFKPIHAVVFGAVEAGENFARVVARLAMSVQIVNLVALAITWDERR